jgi:hypothetical protein
MPWDLRGNNIAGADFLGTTNLANLDIRTSGTSRLIIQTGNPIVTIYGANNWHSIQGNIIVGDILAFGSITPFLADGEIRAKRITSTNNPANPGRMPFRPGMITADSILADRIVAGPVSGATIDGRGGIDSRTNSFHWSGVYGQTDHAEGFGVYGRAVSSAQGRGYAGFFDGKVLVTDKLEKQGGSFKIDHPRDPANMYLNHSVVESSEMKTFYDGVEQLDKDGTAWVELPEWFQVVNKDFRYQLTAIGGAAPELHVAEEIADNRFRIAGGEEGMKVCWQVSGTRSDPWAEANPMVVEEEKPEEERGFYIQPDLYGAAEEQQILRRLPKTESEVIEEEYRDAQE